SRDSPRSRWSSWPGGASAPSSDTRLLLAREHAARSSVLSRAGTDQYRRSLRPCCAWCSRARTGAALLEGALVADKGATARGGGVLTITLNRPEVLNALNTAVHEGLTEAYREAREPDVRAVVLTGAGRGFCVGQDLTEFREGGGDIVARLRGTYHPTI